MSIFETKEITKAQKITEAKNRLATDMDMLLKRMVGTLERGMEQVWNPEGFTTEELMASYGTDALQLFQVAGGLKQLIATIRPDIELPETPREVIPNDDGTVTIGDPIE